MSDPAKWLPMISMTSTASKINDNRISKVVYINTSNKDEQDFVFKILKAEYGLHNLIWKDILLKSYHHSLSLLYLYIIHIYIFLELYYNHHF